MVYYYPADRAAFCISVAGAVCLQPWLTENTDDSKNNPVTPISITFYRFLTARIIPPALFSTAAICKALF